MIRPHTRGLGRRNGSFATRAERLVELGVITDDVRSELQWLWSIRVREHFVDYDQPEWDVYTRDDYNRAYRAFISLRDGLSNHFGRE